MIRPIIFSLGLIALISAASALESNPIVKIDKYLSRRTNSFDPSVNFKLAEEYYEAEKQAKHKFTSNKKLLEALEDFLGLKSLIDGDKKKNCNIKAAEILARFVNRLDSYIRSFNHLYTVYSRIRDIYADDCRKEIYAILDEKLETMEELDIVVTDRLYDLLEAKMFPRGREYGETAYSVNVMYGAIITAEDSDILDPYDIQGAWSGSCGTEIENNWNLRESVQECWLDPCQQYVNKLGYVFNMGAGLKPDVGIVDNASPETQRYFEHWTRFRVCEALLLKGASQLKRDLMYEGSRYGGGSSGGATMAAMVGR